MSRMPPKRSSTASLLRDRTVVSVPQKPLGRPT
jgi:hypothetical protein